MISRTISRVNQAILDAHSQLTKVNYWHPKIFIYEFIKMQIKTDTTSRKLDNTIVLVRDIKT